MQCIKVPRFSILVNGNSSGFFISTRDLRQGSPISPYLFYIVMEFFSASWNSCVINGSIRSPFKTKDITISHLLFADDVMIFSKTSPSVAQSIVFFLEEFNGATGLIINSSKSSIFFSNRAREEQQCTAATLSFQIEKLPVHYLGLPLFSSRLKLVDCNPLLEKIRRSLAGWKAKTISIAGRLQLIKATLSTFHSYKGSSFLLPKVSEPGGKSFVEISSGVAPMRREKWEPQREKLYVLQ